MHSSLKPGQEGVGLEAEEKFEKTENPIILNEDAAPAALSREDGNILNCHMWK